MEQHEVDCRMRAQKYRVGNIDRVTDRSPGLRATDILPGAGISVVMKVAEDAGFPLRILGHNATSAPIKQRRSHDEEHAESKVCEHENGGRPKQLQMLVDIYKRKRTYT